MVNARLLGEVLVGWLEANRPAETLGTLVRGGAGETKERPWLSVLTGEGEAKHKVMFAVPVVLRGEWLPKIAGGGGTAGAVDAGEFEAGFQALAAVLSACANTRAAEFASLRSALAAEGMLLRLVQVGRSAGEGAPEDENARRVEAGWVLTVQTEIVGVAGG